MAKLFRNRYFTSATDTLGISTSEERVCGLQNQSLRGWIEDVIKGERTMKMS